MKSCLRVRRRRPLVALDYDDQARWSILDTDWAQARAVSGMEARQNPLIVRNLAGVQLPQDVVSAAGVALQRPTYFEV